MNWAWRDPLFRLHSSGWNSDDIDEACEALSEACTEGAFQGTPVWELTPTQIRTVLTADVEEPVAIALRLIAAVRTGDGQDGDELRQALYDLDAFAYDFAGDD